MTTAELVTPSAPGRPVTRLSSHLAEARRGPDPATVHVAVLEPDDLVTAGWGQLLGEASAGRFRLTGPDSPASPDLTVYGLRRHDTSAVHDSDLHALIRTTGSRVVVTHWDDTPELVGAALRCGAHGALSRRLPQDRLLAALEDLLRDRPVAEPAPAATGCHPEVELAGLSAREMDVLVLVARGLTNQEIADRLYLTINTVKSYIRYGYRKIGAERRSHAVVWVERHGLADLATLPDEPRTLEPVAD